MKNPFVKAETKKKYLKISVYGGPGVGKTWFALGFPNPAVIDLEGGTDFYGDRFNFSVLDTKSFADVMNAVEFLEKGTHNFQTLIIDPITIVYEALQEGRFELRIKNVGKASTGEEGSDFSYRDWASIKKFYKLLMHKLTNLPMNIILLGRVKDETIMKGKEMLKTGNKVIDGEKSTPYIPDIYGELIVENKKRILLVEKSRCGEWDQGDKIINPSYETFRHLVDDNQGTTIATHASEEEASQKDAEFFQQQESGKKPNDGSQQQKPPQQTQQKSQSQRPQKEKQGTIAGENGNGNGITSQSLCGKVAMITKNKDDPTNYVELWKTYCYKQYSIDSLSKLSTGQLKAEYGYLKEASKRPNDFKKFLENYRDQPTIDSKEGMIKTIKSNLIKIFDGDRDRIDFFFSGLGSSVATIDDLSKLSEDELIDVFNKVEITYNEHMEEQKAALTLS